MLKVVDIDVLYNACDMRASRESVTEKSPYVDGRRPLGRSSCSAENHAENDRPLHVVAWLLSADRVLDPERDVPS